MKRLTSVLILAVLLSACATDPLIDRCYTEVQSSDFPLASRVRADFAPAGIHESRGRRMAIIPVQDHQGNEDWLVCVYDQETGKLLSFNSAEVVERQVQCSGACKINRWDF